MSTEPWRGRALHFVGIGGAGMSGLALVAHALGATVTGSDRAAGSPYAGPLRAAGVEPAIGPRRGQRARPRPSSSSPRRSRRRTRSAPIGRERGQRELHRAAAAGRAHPAAPDARRHRHPRQDDDVEHARPRAARLRHGSRLPRRRRRPLDRRQRRLGGGGVARGRGRRVRPLAARAAARRRRAHQRRARPPHDLRLPARRRRHLPGRSSASRERAAVIWDRPGPAGARARGPRGRAVRRRPRADRRRLALHARRRRGRAVGPGRPQRPQRRRGAARRPARRRRSRAGRGRAARLPGRRPALRAARPHRRGRRRGRRLRAPPDGGRRDARGRAHARPPPRVAVFQPHLFSRTARTAAGVRRRARRSPTRSSCSTSTRRASGRRTSRA